jgi:uncharacterized protein (DUF849 family)
MNFEAFITCALTGAGDTTGKSDKVPVTPKQIADSAIEAAKAGAAIAHCHVREPETGKWSRRPELYKEVVDRIRSADTDVIINLTMGMGGDLVFGPGENPLAFDQVDTDMVGPMERVKPVEQLLPDICSIDCGSMNFFDGNYVMINTPLMIRALAKRIQELGVKPELEVFDTGHLVFVKKLIEEGLIDDPCMIQLCTGIPFGAPPDPLSFIATVHQLPPGAVFSGFAIGRDELPFVAMAVLAGGNVRVGLEDNLYLSRGVTASNGDLVERAVTILEAMGVRILRPDEVRAKLKLKKRS